MAEKNGSKWMRLGVSGAFSALLVLSNALSAYADEQGWVLTQRSIKFGDQYVYIGANGVKVINPRSGVGLVTSGPEWNVVFFNDQQHTYYTITFDKWKAHSAAARLPRLNWSQPVPATILGMKATQYDFRLSHADAESRARFREAKYFAATDIHVAPRLSELMSATYGTPDTQCVPLKFTYIDQNNKPGVLLDTYHEQKTSIPANFFAQPPGYKLARNEADVVMDDSQRQIMNDIAKDLGETGNPSQAASHIPAQGVQLPNGRTVSKDEVNKFIDSLKSK